MTLVKVVTQNASIRFNTGIGCESGNIPDTVAAIARFCRKIYKSRQQMPYIQ